jgi:hypothetical protein
MATEKEVAEIVAKLAAAYPTWNASIFTVKIYFEDLQDIPFGELAIAAQACRSEVGRKFAPSVGELREAVMNLRKAAANVPSAFDAWKEVRIQIAEVGRTGAPKFSSPLTAKVVRDLGWVNLCMSENTTADRARFLQDFEELAKRAEAEAMLVPTVREYLESQGARLLDAGEVIKQLSDGMKG